MEPVLEFKVGADKDYVQATLTYKEKDGTLKEKEFVFFKYLGADGLYAQVLKYLIMKGIRVDNFKQYPPLP